MSTPARKWWKEGVGYQVWPASFKDSNGDGLGDIPGVISKLGYLKDLGVDFVWLSPMYDSPRNDMGYDIRNYEDVDPDFGTLADMDSLIKGLHDRGMKLILDLVVNHTSNEHKWFQESRKSKDNSYSDYYIWRDPKIIDGKKVEPNNWASVFGGSAWKYVEARDQYYFHLFLDSQPDLNWENPEVRQAIYQTAIRFWLDRGVDGFRVDAVNAYNKNTLFPDSEVKDEKDLYHGPDFRHIINGPKMHEWLQEQRREVLDAYGDVLLVGELGLSSREEILKYIDPKARELDMILDFEVVMPQDQLFLHREQRGSQFSLSAFRNGFAAPQRVIHEHGSWATVFLENHDQPRSINKFSSKKPELRWQSGKLLALMLSTLSGTLFIYQGQEIGMSGIPRDWPLKDLKDAWWLEYFREIERKYPGDAEMKQKAIVAFEREGRDHARTPVQWSNEEPSAGFSTTKAWMRVNDNFRDGVNVAEQQGNEDSLLTFWKRCLVLRQEHINTLTYGKTTFLDEANEKVLFYTKTSTNANTGKEMLIVLNFTDEDQELELPEQISLAALGELLLGTHTPSSERRLAAREGRVYEIR